MSNQELQQNTHQENDLQQEASLLMDTDLLNHKGPIYDQYIEILKDILPHVGKDEEKIVYTQITLALKLEGLIGKKLTDKDSQLISIIKDAIMSSKERKENALLMAERVLNQR